MSAPDIAALLARLEVNRVHPGAWSSSEGWSSMADGREIAVKSPASAELIATVRAAGAADYEEVMRSATAAAAHWRAVPAPKRGEAVRLLGEALRAAKTDLGTLVSLENGKILPEGLGEVQEMIDIADFAVGQSRMLYGLTMHSERSQHRMYEQWHPLGIVGIISAFNFPVAVWSWNTALAWICGNVTIWKPSEKTPLCAIACQNIMMEVIKENNLPEGVSSVLVSDHEIGQKLVDDKRVALVSFTGSTRVGRMVSSKV